MKADEDVKYEPLISWLNSFGLGRYKDQLIKNEFTLKSLQCLSEEDLNFLFQLCSIQKNHQTQFRYLRSDSKVQVAETEKAGKVELVQVELEEIQVQPHEPESFWQGEDVQDAQGEHEAKHDGGAEEGDQLSGSLSHDVRTPMFEEDTLGELRNSPKSSKSSKSSKSHKSSKSLKYSPKHNHNISDLPVFNAKKRKTLSPDYFWLFIALVAHSIWGTLPGVARILQTNSNVGAFGLLTVLSLSNTIIMGVPLIARKGLRQLFAMEKLWLFYFIVITYMITATYATKLTLSIHIQLLWLSIPFLVGMFNRVILNEILPPHTTVAMIVSSLGAFLALFGELIETQSINISWEDWVGYMLGLVSAGLIGCFYVFVRAVKTVSSEALVFIQFPGMFVVVFPLSAATEDWSAWLNLDVKDIFLLAWYVIVIFGVGNFAQIVAIRHLGAPLVSTLLPWRLVIAMSIGASSLLSESNHLGNLNILGVSIVIVTLIVYLFVQYRKYVIAEAALVFNEGLEDAGQVTVRSSVISLDMENI